MPLRQCSCSATCSVTTADTAGKVNHGGPPKLEQGFSSFIYLYIHFRASSLNLPHTTHFSTRFAFFVDFIALVIRSIAQFFLWLRDCSTRGSVSLLEVNRGLKLRDLRQLLQHYTGRPRRPDFRKYTADTELRLTGQFRENHTNDRRRQLLHG